MELSALKPILSAFILPPAGPLLLACVGLALLYRQRKQVGYICIALGLTSSWVLSCDVTARWLNQRLLQQYAFVSPADLTKQRIQAIVVLGSGIQSYAPEYDNISQPSSNAVVRLRYGAWLSMQTNIPLAYSGGKGWASKPSQTTTEAETADYYLQSFNLPSLKWRDDQSSDTAQNAKETANLLLPQKVTRIALVTHGWHMERAVSLFARQGFDVTPAPVQAIAPEAYDLINLLPSSEGLENSRNVLREALALLVLKIVH